MVGYPIPHYSIVLLPFLPLMYMQVKLLVSRKELDGMVGEVTGWDRQVVPPGEGGIPSLGRKEGG